MSRCEQKTKSVIVRNKLRPWYWKKVCAGFHRALMSVYDASFFPVLMPTKPGIGNENLRYRGELLVASNSCENTKREKGLPLISGIEFRVGGQAYEFYFHIIECVEICLQFAHIAWCSGV